MQLRRKPRARSQNAARWKKRRWGQARRRRPTSRRSPKNGRRAARHRQRPSGQRPRVPPSRRRRTGRRCLRQGRAPAQPSPGTLRHYGRCAAHRPVPQLEPVAQVGAKARGDDQPRDAAVGPPATTGLVLQHVEDVAMAAQHALGAAVAAALATRSPSAVLGPQESQGPVRLGRPPQVGMRARHARNLFAQSASRACLGLARRQAYRERAAHRRQRSHAHHSRPRPCRRAQRQEQEQKTCAGQSRG
jgi:hypothetical protein